MKLIANLRKIPRKFSVGSWVQDSNSVNIFMLVAAKFWKSNLISLEGEFLAFKVRFDEVKHEHI